jgi:ABC-type phosphate transport system substrate-binding protein
MKTVVARTRAAGTSLPILAPSGSYLASQMAVRRAVGRTADLASLTTAQGTRQTRQKWRSCKPVDFGISSSPMPVRLERSSSSSLAFRLAFGAIAVVVQPPMQTDKVQYLGRLRYRDA